jgi:hypothetical protein
MSEQDNNFDDEVSELNRLTLQSTLFVSEVDFTGNAACLHYKDQSVHVFYGNNRSSF